MAFIMFWFCLPFLLSEWSTVRCADIPDGVLDMECHDRYFSMTIDLSFAGNEPRLEAVDSKGVYPITEQYQALCGYSITIPPLLGQAEFRASYFSCHAENQADDIFVFKFNLIATHEGQLVTYNLTKTCSPSLPWSPREVTCEINYMETSVRSDMTCPSGTKKDDWTAALTTAYVSSTSDWQVMFQKPGQPLTPMTLAKARTQGYMFDVTDGRLVFRTSYGQPHSFTTMVEGVPVEVIRSTLFSRQSWVVLMVDLVAACSMYKGSYNDGNAMWKTPLLLSPLGSGISGLNSQQLRMGFNGQLLKPQIVNETQTTAQISFPYNDAAGYRKSLVLGNVYHERVVFYLYFEHLFVDEDHVETRVRLHRQLTTPPLSRPAFSDDRTVVEERVFTVYLGDFLEDVKLAAVRLNGQHRSVDKVVYSNNTHGYTLRVPFEDNAVQRQLSKKGVLQYRLDINCSLVILPEKEPFYHLTSVAVLVTDVFPPTFKGYCSEKFISFKRKHKLFDPLWQAYIGTEPLTPELAVQKGYIMHNDSQSLRLDVPFFSAGYTYKNIDLRKFSGSFELIIKDAKTLEVQGSTVKTCHFPTTELVVCSTEGQMTVVANLSMVIPTGGKASKSTLLDQRCGPREAAGNRVLFSFPLSSCGTRVKIDMENGHIVYENELVFNQNLLPVQPPVIARNATEKVTVQCVYPLSGLYRLFLKFRFDSDFPGVGSVVHHTNITNSNDERLHPRSPRGPRPIVRPAHNSVGPSLSATTTSLPTTTSRLITQLPAIRPRARAKYIRVLPGVQHVRRT